MFSLYDKQYASNLAEGVDTAFMVIFGIGFFFLIGITAVMVWFIIRYHRKRHPKPVQVRENPLLEISWTVLPLILVMLMFYYGYIAFTPMRDIPADAMIVKTTGFMWDWEFEYPDKKVSRELVLPIDEPVVLEMNSRDVVHSLYIPAFRIKEDLVPGQTTYMWFIPERLGNYEILCAEYCGLRHSFIESVVRVLPREEYDQWLANVPVAVDPGEGLTLLKQNACTGCHSLDGTKLVGPTFKGIAGKEETVLINGKSVRITVDSAYLHKAIVDPDAELVEGYPKGLMKSYEEVMKEEDIQKVVQYLMTLKPE